MLCVKGVQYLWLGHADQKGAGAQLAWSRDHARTWTFAAWQVPELGLVGFVNFGRDYYGARDRYVYAYSHDRPQADTPADRFILVRVPAVYDAPEPWGPWSTAFFTPKWDVGPGEHGDFPSKWMSEDGKTLHLIFSGDDAFSVHRATLRLR